MNQGQRWNGAGTQHPRWRWLLWIVLAMPSVLFAPPPAWWAASGATNGDTPDDFAAANIGQLKHIASKAVDELQAHLPGGAGTVLLDMVAKWRTPPEQQTPPGPPRDDFAAVNIGQLKAVAKPFYDRLIAVGYTSTYPWTTTTADDDDFAMANLGQLKQVFRFDVAKDTDGDGIPDWWEMKYNLSPTNPADAGQPGSGGMTNLQHFVNGSAPTGPAPTANITVGQPQGDLNATQSIYPPGGVGSMIINGDFSRSTITDSAGWQRFYGTAGVPGWGFRFSGAEYGYGAIPGWSAIAGASGTIVELQRSGTNQFCELDADWTLPRPAAPRPESDHGIQQMMLLPRGTYLLAFDYAGRKWGSNLQNIAGDFVVTVQSGMTGTPVEVFRKTGAVADWKRAFNTITVQGGTTNGASVPVILKFDITDAPDSFGALIDNVILLLVDIEPDANMAGVVGDVVKSAKGDSTIKHFVTPKAAAAVIGPPEPINQPHVVLKASGITADQITPGNASQIVEWDGGEAVPNEPLKRRVKRDATGTGPTEVKIKVKQGGAVAAQMDVWVIWANCTPKVGVAEYFQHPNQIHNSARWEVDRSPNKDDPESLWKFTFKIEPTAIFTADEKPKLDGGSERPVPGKSKKHAQYPTVEADSALKKWDVSRQWKATIRNPGGISKADLIAGGIGAELAKNQPLAADSPVVFPTDKAEGNDDPPGPDEDDNPYVANTSALLSHAVGEVTSLDGPRLTVVDSWGATGNRYSEEMNFDEFVRVELWDGNRTTGRFWFRISDTTQGKWHHYLDATYDAMEDEWSNNHSSSGTGHPKP